MGAWVTQLSMDQRFRTTHVPSQACRPTAACTGQTPCLCFLTCKLGVGDTPVLRSEPKGIMSAAAPRNGRQAHRRQQDRMGPMLFSVLLFLANCLMQTPLYHQHDFSADDSVNSLAPPPHPTRKAGPRPRSPQRDNGMPQTAHLSGTDHILEPKLKEPCPPTPARVQHLLLSFVIHSHHNDRSCP